MDCPICETPMTHMGYFRWTCEDCGHCCDGELPPADASGEEEGAP